MSDNSEIIPLVNGKMLEKCVGRLVKFPCKVLQCCRNTAKVLSTDNLTVDIHFENEPDFEAPLVEIKGAVVSPTTIAMESFSYIADGPELEDINNIILILHDPMMLPLTYGSLGVSLL
ncbi:hypothetical protein D9756_002853 [Leucocoprinus leucothites]|uniref:Uncharacterized protein n=1 Tax=Leucocoprinus leucothites TaxID=201217 RepID=A0A8H5GC97_9AGAR|nr:hypothetical protein D9756_002853 [Leucoagaricus leucothites]